MDSTTPALNDSQERVLSQRDPVNHLHSQPQGGYAAKKNQKQLARQERRAQEVKEREEKAATLSSGPIEIPSYHHPLSSSSSSSSTHGGGDGRIPLPPIVFGTHMLQHEACEAAVFDALAVGYRGIDTASRYFNEENVCAALKRIRVRKGAGSNNGEEEEEGVPLKREDVFLITKIGPQDTKKGREAIVKSFLESLRKLDTPYMDCYLMHWPGVGGIAPEDPKAIPKRIEAWRAMCELKEKGLVRFIGVSNFKKRHFESLVYDAETNPTAVDVHGNPLPLPDIHQTELHPLCKQDESTAFCQQHGILLQQYSPLAKADERLFAHPAMIDAVDKLAKLLENERIPSDFSGVVDVASYYSTDAATSAPSSSSSPILIPIAVTPSLVSLLWGRYKGYASACVRSTNPLRVISNLSAAYIYTHCIAPIGERVAVLAELDALLANEKDLHTCWESSKVA